jgi:hypothetical protein
MQAKSAYRLRICGDSTPTVKGVRYADWWMGWAAGWAIRAHDAIGLWPVGKVWNPDDSYPTVVEVREEVRGTGTEGLGCVAGCVAGKAACVAAAVLTPALLSRPHTETDGPYRGSRCREWPTPAGAQVGRRDAARPGRASSGDEAHRPPEYLPLNE